MAYFKQSKNQSSFIGRLGNDPELISEHSLSLRFSVATTLVTGKGDEKREETIWVPCQIWKDNPAAKYLKKGKNVAVDAYYATGTSGEGENKRYHHHFQVRDVLFLDAVREEESNVEVVG